MSGDSITLETAEERLTCFVYLLTRDSLAWGEMSRVLRESSAGPNTYTSSGAEVMARSFARELLGLPLADAAGLEGNEQVRLRNTTSQGGPRHALTHAAAVEYLHENVETALASVPHTDEYYSGDIDECDCWQSKVRGLFGQVFDCGRDDQALAGLADELEARRQAAIECKNGADSEAVHEQWDGRAKAYAIALNLVRARLPPRGCGDERAEQLARFTVVDFETLEGWTEGDKQTSRHEELTFRPGVWEPGTTMVIYGPEPAPSCPGSVHRPSGVPDAPGCTAVQRITGESGAWVEFLEDSDYPDRSRIFVTVARKGDTEGDERVVQVRRADLLRAIGGPCTRGDSGDASKLHLMRANALEDGQAKLQAELTALRGRLGEVAEELCDRQRHSKVLADRYMRNPSAAEDVERCSGKASAHGHAAELLRGAMRKGDQ